MLFRYRNQADRKFPRRFLPVLALLFGLLAQNVPGQDRPGRFPRLRPDRYKDGALTLRAFTPVSQTARNSVVLLERDGVAIALGTVIDTNGLALTKASELGTNKLTCKLADGSHTQTRFLAADEENDLALVQISAAGLKPVEWAADEAKVGQWAVTPGIEAQPESVGIISVPPRKILPKRALIGVQLDFSVSAARIAQVMPGLGAEQAGLKRGDTILQVNGEPVKTNEELVSTLRTFREGQTVKLRVRREDREFQARVTMMIPKPEPGSRGFDRQERMNRFGGELSRRGEGFQIAIQHDTVLQPWQCGGPLLDLDGKAIGLNIARAGRVASYALPASLVQDLIEKLKTQAGPSLD